LKDTDTLLFGWADSGDICYAGFDLDAGCEEGCLYIFDGDFHSQRVGARWCEDIGCEVEILAVVF